MIASVYIKDGNIHLYNEKDSFSGIGGIAYELGKPLLNFLCYEQEQFDDAFSITASAFDNEYAHWAAKSPEFKNSLNEVISDQQQRGEIYLSFYSQILMDFVFTFIDSPQVAIEKLSDKIPEARERLSWVWDISWPSKQPYPDKEKQLYRAALDVVALLSADLKQAQEATKYFIEALILIRQSIKAPKSSSMEYLYIMEELNMAHTEHYHFIEHPFRAFYGMTKDREIALLFEIDSVKSLLRFEFIKMIEHDIFIKKCKNCEQFFIPRRRIDTEYCDRIWGKGSRKCSEIGATLRYEKKIASSPILDAHKKAYRRFNSRTRTGNMTNEAFFAWTKEAATKRDECLAGELSFDEFVAWLEQGRVRKARNSKKG